MATEVTTTTTLCDKSFSVDYMLLSPKDVRLWDLIKLLFSKNIGNRSFIDCPDGTVEESFSQRFVIFISIVAQKVLHLVDKPLGWVGSAIEFMPNFTDANGGFFKLLGNVVTGFILSSFFCQPFTCFIFYHRKKNSCLLKIS
ncbi:triacylglycerol lipase-like 1 [Artemisia annua]|uniref:Triacylglycerol lipase-like 1 n=1 Tax=Artemisia annua TaxID=35608 RepID=A0A2U1PMY2_ARTAN|nr:triacylglycerol lipase-like 1 [Artemisia annua]